VPVVTRFVVGIKGSSHVIYALGDSIDTGDLVSIYEHNAGSTLGWVKPSNYESTIDYDLLNGNVFFEYRDKIYTFADNRLINFTIGGSWDSTGEDLTSITDVADPVHHPADDIAYFFYDNVVGKIDGASAFVDDVLVLPTNLKITSACAIGIMANGEVGDNILYMAIMVKRNGDFIKGIWAIDSNGNATLDYVEEDVTDDGTAVYNGILKTGNMWTIAHSSDGSVNRTKVTSGAKFTFTSKYESLIFDEGDNSKTKKLIGVTVMTEALPADGQVVLKYRKDEDLVSGSWTTIFTEATDDSIEFDAINISGATLPEYKEIQFRIESTGGAEITGLKWRSEILDKQKY